METFTSLEMQLLKDSIAFAYSLAHSPHLRSLATSAMSFLLGQLHEQHLIGIFCALSPPPPRRPPGS
jgi:hypothetical protein